MERYGIANLPLHPGHAPRWLFDRMVKLSGEIVKVISIEFGPDEVLRRFADPFWFQAFSCVIGFDWHSSGTTTVTLGSLKQSLSEETGIMIAGGKGKASKKTPEEIEKIGDLFNISTSKVERLKYTSKITAKVDNAVLQDGYNLYHHVILISESGNWVVVQQGMNPEKKYARRYHWIYGIENYVNEPHSGIIGEKKEKKVLDLTAEKSKESRKIAVDIVKDGPEKVKNSVIEMKDRTQKTLDDFSGYRVLHMPWHINWNALFEAYEIQPKNYEELISVKGIGPSTVRALAYISEIIYGAEPSWRDPVKYSFALGGKDGVPKPVDRDAYDKSIEILQLSIEEAKIGEKGKIEMLKRLRRYVPD